MIYVSMELKTEIVIRRSSHRWGVIHWCDFGRDSHLSNRGFRYELGEED